MIAPQRDLDATCREKFDVIVIGGGIIGAGIARDASLRGLKTLLVEKEDFACGTTSRSSRLVHGGLRYLRQLWFRLVRQDLKEREILLGTAPHLVHELQFVIPLLKQLPDYRLSMPLGMMLYDLLSHDKSLPSHRRLSLRETTDMEPCLAEVEGLTGSYLYYDCEAELMERLCLENVLSAADKGAHIINHAAVTGLLAGSTGVSGVQIKDTLSGEDYSVQGKIVINAAGPWADSVLAGLPASHPVRLRCTKGVHLLTDRLSDRALVLFARSDGRLFFVIPWQGYSLIGTTDTYYAGDLDRLCATAEDVDYLYSELHNYLPGLRREGVYHAIAGVRMLVSAGQTTESNISRSHRLVDHERENGISGLLSVFGGKITAYRKIAGEAIDLACRKLGHEAVCVTAETPLPGAPAVPQSSISENAGKAGLPVETVQHLAYLYGSRFRSVLKLVASEPRLGQPICPGYPDILAQVRFSVEEEYALTAADFLLRRSDMGLKPSQGTDALETVINEMGSLLSRSKEARDREADSYRQVIELTHSFRA